jgi:hypothetical protein
MRISDSNLATLFEQIHQHHLFLEIDQAILWLNKATLGTTRQTYFNGQVHEGHLLLLGRQAQVTLPLHFRLANRNT